MFSKLSTLLLASVAVLAVATPTPGESPSDCDTGDLQCCEQTGSASDPGIATVLSGLGINAQDVDALVGLTCSPISVVGVGSAGDCSASAVCCSDNSFGGVASLGCVPVSL